MASSFRGTKLYLFIGLLGILPFLDISVGWRSEYSLEAGIWVLAAAVLLAWTFRQDTRADAADAELGRMAVEANIRNHGLSREDARLYETICDTDMTKLVESRDLLAKRFLALAKSGAAPCPAELEAFAAGREGR